MVNGNVAMVAFIIMLLVCCLTNTYRNIIDHCVILSLYCMVMSGVYEVSVFSCTAMIRHMHGST